MSPGEIFLRLVNISIAAGWLILAVAVLRLVLRRAPKRYICLLWALAAVRLLCPALPESPASLVPSRETLPVGVIYAADRVGGGYSPNYSINTGLPVSGGEGNIPMPATPDRALVVSEGAGILWAAGALGMTAYALWSCFRLRRRVAAAVLVEKGVKRCEFIDTPFVLGILRPTVYLPTYLTEVETEYVLAHERAHIRGLHHLWKPLGYLILTVYCFDPLVWMAYVLFCRDLEAACDERVCRDMSLEDRQGYSEALLCCAVRRRRVAPCPLAFGETGVKARIRAVMSFKKPGLWAVLAAVAAIAAAAVFLMTDPVIELQSPFGATYRPAEIIYGEGAEESFSLASDMELLIGPEGEKAGRFEDFSVTSAILDHIFPGDSDGRGPIKRLCRQNRYAWRAVSGDRQYILLQQRDGSLYMVVGYYDAEGETDYFSDDSRVLAVVRLTETEGNDAAPDEAMELLLKIESGGPGDSAESLIAAHQSEFDLLVSGGEETLSWGLTLLLEGAEGLRADILWEVCERIIDDIEGFNFEFEVEWVDPDNVGGNDWFNFYKYVTLHRMEDCSDSALRRDYPAGWILIQLMGGREMMGGSATFYERPFREGVDSAPVTAAAYELTPEQGEELEYILGQITDITPDDAANRRPFTFDGEFTLNRTGVTCFFSYESSIIYYDGLFGVVDAELMEYIKGLR